MQLAFGHTNASVRGGHIRREMVLSLPTSNAAMIAVPSGPPRLWQSITETIATAFQRGVTGQVAAPAALDRASKFAAQALQKFRESLIEPHLRLDADVAFIYLAEKAIHFALSGGVRVYRARAGVPERLHTGVAQTANLTAGTLFTATETLHHDDVFVFGGREAFTVRSLGSLASAMANGARPTAEQQCEALLGPCRSAGIGAGVIVVTN